MDKVFAGRSCFKGTNYKSDAAGCDLKWAVLSWTERNLPTYAWLRQQTAFSWIASTIALEP
jgi:hypothetical protein